MLTLPAGITHLVFDLDGTLYNPRTAYVTGRETIANAQDFLRLTAFQFAETFEKPDEEDVQRFTLVRYRKKMSEGGLQNSLREIPQEKKASYAALVERHGSNGRVFTNEFSFNTSFHGLLLGNIPVGELLVSDSTLQGTISKLSETHSLGMITSECYSTVERAVRALGLSIDQFQMRTNSEYPVFCAENTQEKKPDLEAFRKFVELACITPQQAVYIGDTLEKDVDPALRFGMHAVLVDPSAVHVGEFVKDCSSGLERRTYFKIRAVPDLLTMIPL